MKIHKIKALSPKVANIPEKPAMKIGLVERFKKNWWDGEIPQPLAKMIIDFLRKREACIEKNYMTKKQHNKIVKAIARAHYDHIEKYMVYKDVVERERKQAVACEVLKVLNKIENSFHPPLGNGELSLDCIREKYIDRASIKPTECKHRKEKK